jgi:hypothetical protein
MTLAWLLLFGGAMTGLYHLLPRARPGRPSRAAPLVLGGFFLAQGGLSAAIAGLGLAGNASPAAGRRRCPLCARKSKRSLNGITDTGPERRATGASPMISKNHLLVPFGASASEYAPASSGRRR